MSFEIIPAHALTSAAQADIANRAFKGYLAGWSEMDSDALTRFLSVQGADLCFSRFVGRNNEPIAFGYINRIGNVSRLSGMATVPEARRGGAARWLLDRLLEEARERGDRLMTLEVFEQNKGAVDLYQKSGFRVITRLFGWRRAASPALPSFRSALTEIDQTRASQMPGAKEYPEIPYQISRHAIAKFPIARAFMCEEACVVVGDTSASSIRVHACLAPEQDWAALSNALAAVLASFPDKEFFAAQTFPEDYGPGIFEPLGFQREPLNQFYMIRNLEAQR